MSGVPEKRSRCRIIRLHGRLRLLFAKEFLARSEQIRHLVRQHGPTVGAAHEVMLRRFLRDYLPGMGMGNGNGVKSALGS